MAVLLRLDFAPEICPAESADFANSAGRYTNACTNMLIHLPLLQEALEPFPGFAVGGCSAAAGGLGAVAPSAGTGVGVRKSDPLAAPDAEARAVELCGEMLFEDFGPGTSAGTWSLEDTPVQ